MIRFRELPFWADPINATVLPRILPLVWEVKGEDNRVWYVIEYSGEAFDPDNPDWLIAPSGGLRN